MLHFPWYLCEITGCVLPFGVWMLHAYPELPCRLFLLGGFPPFAAPVFLVWYIVCSCFNLYHYWINGVQSNLFPWACMVCVLLPKSLAATVYLSYSLSCWNEDLSISEAAAISGCSAGIWKCSSASSSSLLECFFTAVFLLLLLPVLHGLMTFLFVLLVYDMYLWFCLGCSHLCIVLIIWIYGCLTCSKKCLKQWPCHGETLYPKYWRSLYDFCPFPGR